MREKEDDVSDEETRDQDEVEAHKRDVGKAGVGETEIEDDTDDVEAHKRDVGRNSVGASDDDDGDDVVAHKRDVG